MGLLRAEKADPTFARKVRNNWASVVVFMVESGMVSTERPIPNYRLMSDPELIQACLKNDKQAWDALVLRYSRLIYATAIKLGLAPEDAAEALQYVCITLLQQLSTLKDQTKLSPWLITLTKRKCYRLRMLRHQHWVSLDQMQETQADIPDPTVSLEKEMVNLERQHLIRQALDTLGEKCQKLIRHLYYEESAMSHQQIAERLSVAVASVGRMRERCLKKLKTVLVGWGF